MGLPRFFKLARPKSFNYIPVFYDEREEELKDRVEKVAKDMGVEQPADFKPRLTRGTMRSSMKKSKRTDRYGSVRIIIILAILFLIAYLVIFRGSSS